MEKYEKIYAAQRHALGEPSPEVVAYFREKTGALNVLDLGAGLEIVDRSPRSVIASRP